MLSPEQPASEPTGVDAAVSGVRKLANEVTFVLIISKLCNLRCRYCYEFPELAQPRRMSAAELTRLFGAIADYVADIPPMTIKFAWQGGEPLIHKPSFFREALALQRQAFRDSSHRVLNLLQTNLTLLDAERIELLAECFDGVGVSHDVLGELRVDVHGRSLADKTVANLDRLIAAGIALGGITVLSRKNSAHVDEIYRFWRERRLPFRLLPMHRGPFPDSDSIALQADEVARALCRCVDLLLQDDAPVELAPISELITDVSRGAPGAVIRYDKHARESVLIVDTDGSVGGMNELLDLRHAYGNLFTSSLDSILSSEHQQRSAELANQRIASTCGSCPFFRAACSGHPIGEGGKEFSARDERGALICGVTKITLKHIERRLLQAGLLDPQTRALRHSLPVSSDHVR